MHSDSFLYPREELDETLRARRRLGVPKSRRSASPGSHAGVLELRYGYLARGKSSKCGETIGEGYNQ